MKLSDIKKSTLLVFGASSCIHCKEQTKDLDKFYKSWKEEHELEIVYISLDTNKSEYENFYKKKTWNSYCDYQGWETKAAKDYYVDATPTYLLLDENRKILLHPKSLVHADVWINNRL